MNIEIDLKLILMYTQGVVKEIAVVVVVIHVVVAHVDTDSGGGLVIVLAAVEDIVVVVVVVDVVVVVAVVVVCGGHAVGLKIHRCFARVVKSTERLFPKLVGVGVGAISSLNGTSVQASVPKFSSSQLKNKPLFV